MANEDSLCECGHNTAYHYREVGHCLSVGCPCVEFSAKAQPIGADSPGVKYDQGKAAFSLLPWDAVREVAHVFTKGAEKYAPRNWEKGLTYSRIFSSTQRHLTSWFQDRQTLDPDGTGLRQIAQAAWGCLVLLAFELRGRTDLDDRPGQ